MTTMSAPKTMPVMALANVPESLKNALAQMSMNHIVMKKMILFMNMDSLTARSILTANAKRIAVVSMI